MKFPVALVLSLAVCVAVVGGCKVINTGDSENAVGRGAPVFDPYAGSRSSAIRFALQSVNGCHLLADGTPVKAGLDSFAYPAACPNPGKDMRPEAPTGSFQMLSGTKYFLNQLTLIDTVTNFAGHDSAANVSTIRDWITARSRFSKLDWTGLAVTEDNYSPNLSGMYWVREIQFGNAAWMKKDYSFLVEVVDRAGEVRASTVYSRKDFLAESPVAGHTRISWRAENILPPSAPGQLDVNADPNLQPVFRTTVKIELFGSTNPFKSFSTSAIDGDAVIRVTWSELPNDPFFFPVSFVKQDTLPSTCFAVNEDGTQGNAVPCDFGLEPEISFGTPANGEGHFAPGETINLYLAAKDSAGNLLHDQRFLPSYQEYFDHKANGLLYANGGTQVNLLESDAQQSIKVIGPLHRLRGEPDVTDIHPYFQYPAQELDLEAELLPTSSDHKYPTPIAGQNLIRDAMAVRWSTRFPVKLPDDVEPGTYLAIFKTHRQYLGERVSKTATQLFQVAQPEPTSYPGRVGNCQICHRGVLSMDNLRHGISVDHVESCKGCHANFLLNLSRDIHKLHVTSPNYPADRNDCTMCHLTQRSATTPSVEVCNSCHISSHGDEYFSVEYAVTTKPNRYGNCADACHAEKPPSLHVLPPQ